MRGGEGDCLEGGGGEVAGAEDQGQPSFEGVGGFGYGEEGVGGLVGGVGGAVVAAVGGGEVFLAGLEGGLDEVVVFGDEEHFVRWVQ